MVRQPEHLHWQQFAQFSKAAAAGQPGMILGFSLYLLKKEGKSFCHLSFLEMLLRQMVQVRHCEHSRSCLRQWHWVQHHCLRQSHTWLKREGRCWLQMSNAASHAPMLQMHSDMHAHTTSNKQHLAQYCTLENTLDCQIHYKTKPIG